MHSMQAAIDTFRAHHTDIVPGALLRAWDGSRRSPWQAVCSCGWRCPDTPYATLDRDCLDHDCQLEHKISAVLAAASVPAEEQRRARAPLSQRLSRDRDSVVAAGSFTLRPI